MKLRNYNSLMPLNVFGHFSSFFLKRDERCCQTSAESVLEVVVSDATVESSTIFEKKIQILSVSE